MNKTALVDEVKSRLGLSTGKAKSVVDSVFAEIHSALAKGEKVSLRGLGVLTRSSGSDGFDFVPAAGLGDGAANGTASASRSATTRTAPAKKAPAAKKAAPVKKAPAKAAPAAKKAAPVKKAPAKAAPAATKAAPVKKAPAKAAPAAKKAAPAKKAPATKAPAKKAPATKTATAKRTAPPKKAATRRVGSVRRAAPVTPPTEPQVVPYEPMHDPALDALAAVAAEQSRPPVVVEPDLSERIVATQAEPELVEQADTVVYSSGGADTEETIGDLTRG